MQFCKSCFIHFIECLMLLAPAVFPKKQVGNQAVLIPKYAA